VHGNAAQCNPSVDVHGQRSAQGVPGQTNPGGGSSSAEGGHSSAKVTEDLMSIQASMIMLF
jgi:hypothetical protein